METVTLAAFTYFVFSLVAMCFAVFVAAILDAFLTVFVMPFFYNIKMKMMEKKTNEKV